jgi:hypothetical protein
MTYREKQSSLYNRKEIEIVSIAERVSALLVATCEEALKTAVSRYSVDHWQDDLRWAL